MTAPIHLAPPGAQLTFCGRRHLEHVWFPVADHPERLQGRGRRDETSAWPDAATVRCKVSNHQRADTIY
jgi:hypothetical protein